MTRHAVPEPAEPQETDLARAARGERVALHRVLVTVRAFVVPYCRARLGRTAAADRLARIICLDVLRALHHRDPARPFMATVHAAAEHAVTTHLLADGLAALPPALPTLQREVLVLRVALGLSTRRTAELLAVTEAAVRIAQHRALHRLRTTDPIRKT